MSVNVEGNEKKIVRHKFKETSPLEFVTFLKSNLQFSIKHNFKAMWQDSQAHLAMDGLERDVTLSHIDFAKIIHSRHRTKFNQNIG